MTPYPGSPLGLGLGDTVDTPTPEMQRSVEEGIERQLRLRDDLHAIAQKRIALSLKDITCACGSKQVQLMSWIDKVVYRCRECRLTFDYKEPNGPT